MNTPISITPEIVITEGRTAIANLNQKEDLGLRYYAAWWLGKFRVKTAVAVESLMNALEDEEDRAPDGGFPLRRNAAKALGKLDDLRAVEPLINCFECDDYYVRESAAQALEMLGDSRAITPLINLLDNAVEEDKLTDYALSGVIGKPHLNQPYEAIIEALGTLQAKDALNLIKPFLDHPTPKIAYAAARAMYQLTRDDIYGEMLVSALEGEDLQLRRSALMDLGAIGYVKSGEAITETLAENSLKLIAMKGLLEYQIKQDQNSELSPDSIKLMNLMDTLL
ncbi:HEAT repeat domain-containing protein [Geminocystis sp. NIES-3709]|uniref:HEAT repeat domain-containing protein n=1 Tax=Geminocystis sp. NIES-3709 TaxID=1617448 RepID=UPI0005FCA1CC|nr:HEAT repeat domain-containing protein [Geminocystis sp. NIES-3709]BAQ64006.1 phycocyanobilin lyase alpha subunit [Geminocystis sp. NIES-3709]